MRRQDFFNDQIKVRTGFLAQGSQVAFGIEQPSDMVDPQAVERAGAQKAQKKSMCVLEDLGQLHPKPSQLVDIEKTPIVDVIGCNAEVSNPPALEPDEVVQLAPGFQLSGRAIDARHCGVCPPAKFCPVPREGSQFELELSGAAGDLRPPLRQARKRVAEAFQIRVSAAQNTVVVQQTHRQLVRVVSPNRKTAFRRIKLEDELSRFKHGSVLRTQSGDEQLVMKVALVGVPIDVEPSSVDGLLPPFQHVQPQRIIGTPNPHVIGYEVQNLLQPMCRERCIHSHEWLCIAELGIERIVVDNVVPVRTARPRLEIRRGIDVADAETRQVGSDLGGWMEAKALVKPQEMGC